MLPSFNLLFPQQVAMPWVREKRPELVSWLSHPSFAHLCTTWTITLPLFAKILGKDNKMCLWDTSIEGPQISWIGRVKSNATSSVQTEFHAKSQEDASAPDLVNGDRWRLFTGPYISILSELFSGSVWFQSLESSILPEMASLRFLSHILHSLQNTYFWLSNIPGREEDS